MTLQRCQVLLEENQHRRLAELANTRRESLSALLRQAVDEYLERSLKDERQTLARRAVERATRLRARSRSKIGARTSEELADLVSRSRDERDLQVLSGGE